MLNAILINFKIMTAVQKPISNIQLELLKVYASNISEEDILHVKDYLARYFIYNRSK